MAPVTVHPPSSASKSYRDAAVHGSPPAMGPTSSPNTSPDATVLVPTSLSIPVELLQQRFPKCVTISTEKFAASTAAWSNGLIGKCLGREVPSDTMLSALSPLWPTIGEWELFPMANGYFVFRFSSPEARDEVLFGGPWVVEGAVLALAPFDPAFRPSDDHVIRAVVWMRLPELPPSFWTDDIISDILRVVGRVVRLDDHTRLRTRGRFARAAVEVDLRLPLEPGITVGVENGVVKPFWQSFQYEHIHLFCVRCRRVGHKAMSCSHPPESAAAGDGPHGCSSTSTSPSCSASSSSMATMDFPPSWSASLMVRRSQRHTTADNKEDTRHPSKSPRAPISKHASGTPLKESGHHQVSSSHVIGHTHMGLKTDGHASLVPGASSGPRVFGPTSRPLGLSSSTSAIGPKQSELSSSNPSSQVAVGLPVVGDGNGGDAVNRVCDNADRMLQEILLEDADDDTDLEFTVAGKKKKQGKGKMKEVCLRLEPRTRTLKKKVKFSGGFGNFSLLHDLVGDATLQEIIDRHGPPDTGLL